MKNLLICGAVFSVLLLGQLGRGENVSPSFEAANQADAEGRYDDSAKILRELIETKGYSPGLCFNLGNAEAKAGHPGQALLNFERARYLAPGDTDIDHNLQAERQKAGLAPNTYRWWEVMIRTINWVFWLGLIIVCLGLILGALVGTAMRPALARGLRISPETLGHFFKGIFFFCIPLALLFGFVELAVVGFGDRIDGVIVAPKEATLLISPFAGAEKVGVIPEGELVTVENRHQDYLWIEARDHHFGWVQEKQIEPVVAGSFDAKTSP